LTKPTAGAPAPEDGERLEIALAQAALGRRVFPAGDERHPYVRWKDEATTDESVIRGWWTTWPGARVAWALPEGVLVVDVVDPVVFLGSGLPIPTAPGQETRRGFSLLYLTERGRPILRTSVPGAELIVGGLRFVIVSEVDSFTRRMTVVPYAVLGRGATSSERES
jgi:Bifunctional DNA primase/polymerase, N-terminal